MEGIKLQTNIEELNNYYIEKFRESRYPTYKSDIKVRESWKQYQSTFNGLLNNLNKNTNALHNIEHEDVIRYLDGYTAENTIKTKKGHIRSLLLFLLDEDREFFDKVTKEQVYWMFKL